MRPFRIRLLSIMLIALACAALFFPILRSPVLEVAVAEEADAAARPFDGKTTLILWYTDEALTDYLNRQAVEFGKTAGDTRVLPVLVSGLGLLESTLEASIAGTDYPDLYITTHDNLEKASLAGIASEVEHAEDVLRGDSFPEAALNSVTWHNLKIAYPFYGETVALLYNRTYLEDEAKLLAEEADEAAPEGEELEKRVQAYLPETIGDLLDFAGHYNAPDEVEAVFSFDVNDLFTDYFFAGDAIDVGGPAGDDPDQVSLYNERVLTCMDIYQQLGQFFAVDPKAVNEEKVLQDFIDGKTVFTIATTEAVQRLKQAREEEDCSFVFGAAPLPALTDEIDTKALSVTNCVVVNGFSEHMTEANRFATFLTSNATADLYTRTNKMPAGYRADFGEDTFVSDMMRAYYSVYEDSAPMPKMIETSNYWIRLEVAFTDIWNGAEVNTTMREVAEQLLSQIRGLQTQVDAIPDPPRILISEELSEEGGEE